MKRILYPLRESWDVLSRRPFINIPGLDDVVRNIINRVRSEGDKAVRDLSLKYDGVTLSEFKVAKSEVDDSLNFVSQELKNAINFAKENIEKFHRSQFVVEQSVETQPGVKCRRKNVPIENIGLYIPGGSAPLFSTVLMLAIPAKIAGCSRIIMCTPPGREGKINPLILFSAWLTGVTDIFRIGGAQAVAAMAYGTESVPAVSKIFGPGNRFVTKAKEIVQADGIAIDVPAGPSEVLVIADNKADPEFIAADLLSQAEHGPDSQVVLLTDAKSLLTSVSAEITGQIKRLPRKEIALKALENSLMILLPDLDECIDFSNLYAPEHLVINTSNASDLADKVINAGSVFIGEYSCESAGDYASGTNHTLPTNGSARNFSGVSVDSFIKKITFQEIDPEGIKKIGPAIEVMAGAENLYGHRNAVTVRLKKTKNDWFR